MAKQIIFDTDARDAMLRGVEKLSNAKVTLSKEEMSFLTKSLDHLL